MAPQMPPPKAAVAGVDASSAQRALQVGDRVMFAAEKSLQPGVVRFRGTTRFAGGEWFGIELDRAAGKNDGSVEDVAYFRCEALHGIFCREVRLQRSQPRREDDHEPEALMRRLSTCVSDGPIKVALGLAEESGVRAELLERLWNRLDKNVDDVLELQEFSVFITSVADDIDEDTIPATYERLLADWTRSLGEQERVGGLDFAFFVELCGSFGFDLSLKQLRECISVLEASAVGAVDGEREELAAIRIQRVHRGNAARAHALRVRHSAAVLAPAAQLREGLTEGGAGIVGVLGSGSFRGADTERIVTAVAAHLHDRLGTRARFVTAGRPGVQQVFAAQCGDGSRLWNVVVENAASGYGIGRDIFAGRDWHSNKEIVPRVGHVYLVFEGGPTSAEQVGIAMAHGAKVVPVSRTGGASAGSFGLPPAALVPPAAAAAEQWAKLGDASASLDDVVAAVGDIVEQLLTASLLEALPPPVALAPRRSLARLRPSQTRDLGAFTAAEALGEDVAAAEMEREFAQLLATWRPRGARAVSSSRGCGVGAAIAPEAPDPLDTAAPVESFGVVAATPPRASRHAPRVTTRVLEEEPFARVGTPEPSPGQELHERVEEAVNSADADLSELKAISQRMEAALEAVHRQATEASTKLQAAHRGWRARKSLAAELSGRSAPDTDK